MSHQLSQNAIFSHIRNNEIINGGVALDPLYLISPFNEEAIFEDVEFTAEVEIKTRNESLISFTNCTFEESFTIYKSLLKKVLLVNCTFKSKVRLHKSETTEIIFQNCTCSEGIDSLELSGKQLSIQGLKSDNSQKHKFFKPGFDRIALYSLQGDSEYIFSTYDSKHNFFSHPTKSTSFTYAAESLFKGSLLVTGMSIDTLTLQGHNNSARIIFQQITVGLVHISQFTNTGILSFANIITNAASSILQCHRSNLGKCEIYEVNFSLFKEIIIDNTNIQDIVTANITWCRSVRSALSGIDHQAHLRENYRQLKNIMIRQNDKVQELAYHRLEMKALLYALKYDRSNWPDRLIIRTNGISNKHGLSWTRALILLTSISAITYIITNLLLGKTSWNSENIAKHVALFLESMNPIRKFSAIYDDSKNNSTTNLAYLIDVLYRFIASYLIFQFISAFRKYVKK